MTERSVKVKLLLEAAEYIASARTATSATKDLDKAARDLRRAHDDEASAAGRVKVEEQKLTELRANAKTKVSDLAAAEERVEKARRQHTITTTNLTAATNKFIQAQKAAGDEAQKAGQKVEDATQKAAKRTNAAFNALAFTGLTVGLPAAAAVGAAGVTLSLTAITAGFAALGVVGVAKTDAVQTAFTKLKTGVVSDVQAMSAPLQGDVVNAIGDVGKAWTRLQPQIATAVQGSAPAIHELTGAVTDLAENAMPGMVTAVKASQPALEGVRTFAGQAGAGLGTFFANASQGAEGAKAGFTVFGGTVQTLEGRLGSLFANLANGSTGPLRSLDVIIDQLSGGLVDMTAKGSGAMGVLQGFGNAGSGAATVLRGVLSAVSALPPELTQLSGSWTAASMIAGKFGVDAGKGFEGLGEKIKTAQGASGKFGAAMGGLAAGAINPAFLAVTALGIGLDILGQKEQEAAQKAAEYRDGVRQLTEAFRQDGGVVGENTKQVDAKALADKNASANLASFGQTITTASQAIQGSSYAYDALKFSAGATLATIADAAGISDENKTALIGLADESLRTGQSYGDLKDKVKLYGTAMDGTNGTVQKFSAAQQSAIEQLINGTGVVGDQIRKQRDMRDAYMQSEHALTGLTNAQIEARNATMEHTAAIYAQQNAALGYRGALLTTQDAEDKYTQTLKNGKSTATQKQQALLDLERAYAAQEQAAYNAAYAESKSTTEDGKKADGLKALNTETINIASKFKKDIPESLQKTIASMSPLEATAAGATIAISKTGDAVYRLPSGKEIKINPTTEEAKAKLADWLAQARTQSITTKVFTDTGPATGEVKDWQNTTRTIQGDTTTYTYTDPATKAVSIWKVKTDATGAKTTTYADIDPATGRVRVWQQNANGTWAQVHASADVSSAEASLNRLVGTPRYITIRTVTVDSGGASHIGTARLNASGALYGPNIGMASGGFPVPSYGNALRNVAQVVPPGTLKWIGDAPTAEVFAPLNGSKRTKDLLKLAAQHEGILGPQIGMASGGMVQAEDGSWVPASFYGPAPKGPHAMLTEEGYAKLRAQATSSGIGSLPQILQDQLRTYGGWSDNPVQQSIQAGTAVRQSSGGSSRAQVIQNFNFPNYIGNRAELIREIRQQVRAQGGDVQVVLGRSG